MSSQRHILRRYESGRAQDFDEQFWPVALALCVLTALTVGTIITLLSGPWMWASLLALPILVGLSLLGLSYIEHRFWRRSMQVALLLSFAIHLLILIIAYRTEIFARYNADQKAQVQRASPIRQIEISVTPREEFWNQPNEIQTPQPTLANEHQPSTSEQPVISPAAASDAAQANPNPKINRRESDSEAIPQVGQSLSRRSRNEISMPSSREPTVAGAAAPTAKAAPAPTNEVVEPEHVATERKSAEQPESVLRRQADPAATEKVNVRNLQRREERQAEPAVAAASSLRRTREVQPQPNATPAQTTTPAAAKAEIENTRSESVAADVAAARRDTDPTLTRSVEDLAEPRPRDRQLDRSAQLEIADAMTATTASNRNERPEQSRAPAETALSEDRAAALERAEQQIQPAAQSGQIARQANADPQWRASPNPSDTIAQSPTDQAAREMLRTAETTERPSDVPTSGSQPRLARQATEVAASPQPIESPAVAPSATATADNAMEAQPMALSRASEGIAGSGASPNLSRANEAAASPAHVASDAARREQVTADPENPAALSPSHASQPSRSLAGLDAPHAALSPTADSANRAAGNDPQPINASASAAVTSASAAGRRGEFSVAIGSADLDLGPTKIVAGRATNENSGGGQPEPSPNVPATARAGQKSGAATASIVADVIANSTTAQLTDGSGQPAVVAVQPNAAASIAQRRGGDASRSSGPSLSEITGAASEVSSAAESRSQSSAPSTERADRGGTGESNVQDDQPNRSRRAATARNATIEAPATEGLPGGLGQRSTADQTSREPESANSDVSRAQHDDVIGATSPAQISSNDGVSGMNKLASSSTLKRSEGSTSNAGEQASISRPDRAARNPKREIDSGTDGQKLARGQATNADTNEAEPSAESLESRRTSGQGIASIGPATREDESSADTSAALAQGSGRARTQWADDQAGDTPMAARTRKGRGKNLNDGAATAIAMANNDDNGAGTNRDLTSDQVAPAERTERAGARVEVKLDEGAGGLDRELQPEVGVASRRASPSSSAVAAEPQSRFRRRAASGELALSPDAIIAKRAFQGRGPENLSSAGPQTEQAIELGLAFLIRQQKDDGRWSLLGFDTDNPLYQYQLDSDTAATGLALLAFQGAGYTHREYQYADRLNRAVAWLVSHQAEDGNLYQPSDKKSNENCELYSHAIATLALTEAYGMTQDPAIRAAAQKAVDFIVQTQDTKNGGWRYFPQKGRRMTDTSVTGWMVMALHSARLAELNVDSRVWSGIEDWLQTAQAPKTESQFVYNPFLKDDESYTREHFRRSSHSTTSIGLLMRIYTGWTRDDPRLLEGADFLLQQLPAEFNSNLRDTYYWYYATQVLRHVDGPRWQTWNNTLHPLLLSTQVPEGPLAGSWNPFTPVEDRWAKFGGRLYLTTLNLLSLEVDYRLLPLYEETAAPR